MDTNSAKERILKEAAQLFAKKGYAETTTREIISEAQSSLSTLNLLFKSKEGVYREVISNTASAYAEFIRPIIEEMNEAEKLGLLDSKCSWDMIVSYIDKMIQWAFDEDYEQEILLIQKEFFNPIVFQEGIPEKILDIYNYLVKLIVAYTGSFDQEWAGALSYTVIETIFGFVNNRQALYVITGVNICDMDAAKTARVQLKGFLLNGLRSYLDLQIKKNLQIDKENDTGEAI